MDWSRQKRMALKRFSPCDPDEGDPGKFYPNDETHKAFGDALRAAAAAGVHILAYDCIVQEDSMNIDEKVEVGLLYTADPIAAHAAHEQQPGLSYNDPHII